MTSTYEQVQAFDFRREQKGRTSIIQFGLYDAQSNLFFTETAKSGVENKMANAAISFLKKIWELGTPPAAIVTDAAVLVRSKKFRKFLAEKGVSCRISQPEDSWMRAQLERNFFPRRAN